MEKKHHRKFFSFNFGVLASRAHVAFGADVARVVCAGYRLKRVLTSTTKHQTRAQSQKESPQGWVAGCAVG